MSEMVKCLATALRDKCQSHNYLVSIPATDHLWVDMARTALAEIRKPTREMAHAASTAYIPHAMHLALGLQESAVLGPEEFLTIWHAAIDKALVT